MEKQRQTMTVARELSSEFIGGEKSGKRNRDYFYILAARASCAMRPQPDNGPNGVAPELFSAVRFSPAARGTVAIQAVLVPPNANCRPRFEMEFLEDVLDVLLHRAPTTPENLADLPVAFSSGDPFNDFKLARGKRPRFRGSGPLQGRLN